MKKIKVQICSGTTCFVMGGSELLLLPDILPDEMKDCVEIEAINCMDKCRNCGEEKSPFVIVNGKSLEKVTLNSLFETVQKIYQGISLQTLLILFQLPLQQ